MEQFITEIRAFNRFYTNRIGLLDQHQPDSHFSLPEARVMYELFHRKNCTASEIMSSIDMDKGFLSRILAKLHKQKMLQRSRSRKDGRSVVLSLTQEGKKAYRKLNEGTHKRMATLLGSLTGKQQEELVVHFRGIIKILEKIPSEQ